ncbi:Pex32p Ecym_7086 [Eremothecium cymbalariae DBVPG|uniref:TECPR1-like DysF domain-containing protein n=1 Tax=Eremothecium cymbalariae (strain CBS 270.75 / DBVPG 7215 / KCTC 17166 / NRRL Y-17582) TaxID=931890 RepID=G8JVS3_ERECY|nr:hypothetical protein Ecym_7086 [Eremothecium cymbalariae DBVPG\
MNRIRKYHAKFVQSHGQKPSLTFTTSPLISKALYQFYPVLIIFDSTLNNIMWMQEDTCMGFIYLTLICFSAHMLKPSVDRSQLFYSWMSFLSLGFLGLSVIYYIHSTLSDMQEDEAPTVDDIIIVLESVLDKLDRIRIEVVGCGLRKRLVSTTWATLKLIVMLTPIHWICMQFFSPMECFMWFLALLFTYHSTWFQCTLRLCWRSLPVRNAYYKIWRMEFGRRYKGNMPLTYRVISNEEVVPFPKSLRGLTGAPLQLQLQNLLLSESSADKDSGSGDCSDEYVKVKIVEFCIDENERKWPKEGWSHHLLPYERQRYSMSFDPLCRSSQSPWRFQEDISRDWWWIDDTWVHSAWQYCDSEWNYLGGKDSIGCYTRCRMWKRKAFRIKD